MKNKKLLEITLLLSSMFTMMAGAIVTPSLPQIERIFHETENIALLTRLIISVPAVFTAAFAPIFGILADKLGRRNLLLFSLILYAIGGASGFIIDDIFLILTGRAILGIAVAGIMTISSTLIGDYFTGPLRNKFIGLQGAFMGFGGVIFVSLAGILADIEWNLPFLIYLLSILAFVTGVFSIKEITGNHNCKQNHSVSRHVRFKAVRVYVYIFMGIVFFYIMPVQLPFFLDKLEYMTNAKIGYILSFMQLTSAIVALNYKRIKSFLDFEDIFSLVLLLMGIGYIMIVYCQEFSFILLAVAISGLGVGLLMPLGNLWIMELAPENKRGVMVGNITTSVYLGQFLSPLIMQPIVVSFGVVNLFFIAGIVMVGVAIVLYLVGLFFKYVINQDLKLFRR